MNKELFARGGVYVTTFAGPERDDGGARKRVNVTANGQYIWLTMEQWSELRAAVLALGLECDGPELGTEGQYEIEVGRALGIVLPSFRGYTHQGKARILLEELRLLGLEVRPVERGEGACGDVPGAPGGA